jgi:hypothetical protein
MMLMIPDDGESVKHYFIRGTDGLQNTKLSGKFVCVYQS